MSRPIALLVNPSAGGGRAARALPAVEAELRRLGLAPRTRRTDGLEHARKLARDAATAGDVVVTLGGDGLIGCVVGELRHIPGAVLGVLPGGRGNDFCRVLGVPMEPVAACAVVAGNVERDLDIGEAGGRAFIGIASLGFDSDANRIANEAPSRLGNLVYAYGALRALISWSHASFTVDTGNGDVHQFRGWSVAAANSKAYGGGMYMAPDAELDDGLLDLVLNRECSKMTFLRLLPRLFKGTHVNDRQVQVIRAAEVTIDADRPFTVYADGDPIGELPITIRAIPNALRVLCPARP